MKQSFQQHIRKGVLEFLVLELLSRDKMYGYQIIQILQKESKEFFVLKEGTLYPILYRLEKDGLAYSVWDEPTNAKTPKKFYCITEKGVAELAEQKNIWKRFSDTMAKMVLHD